MYRFRNSYARTANAVANRVSNIVMNKAVGAALTAGAAYAGRRLARPASQAARPMSAIKPKSKPKGKGSKAKSTSQLAKQVANLSRKVSVDQGTLTFYSRQTSRCLASVNQCAYLEVGGVPNSAYEDVLAQLRFFDSATPNTLVQASGASATYKRDYLFSYYHTIDVRNNYQVPCKVTMYIVTPKADTSILPVTAFTNGLTDIGSPSSTSSLLYPTISPQFNQLWKIQDSKTKFLQPGQMASISSAEKNISYDPSLTDSQTSDYQKKNKACVIFVRVEGCLAHDTANDQQGFAQAGVDISYVRKMICKYDAGIELDFVYINDTADAFTNGAVVSSYPVADNIGYSLS